MTDRIRHLTVILDDDYREDEVKAFVAAIRQNRHVSDVVPHVVTLGDLMARTIIKAKLLPEIYDAIQKVFEP